MVNRQGNVEQFGCTSTLGGRDSFSRPASDVLK
jgi:hypothetical protein